MSKKIGALLQPWIPEAYVEPSKLLLNLFFGAVVFSIVSIFHGHKRYFRKNNIYVFEIVY